MSKAKMAAARELIQEKRYDEARAILVTVDHPTAREWLARIDNLTPASKSSGVKPNRAPLLLILFVVAIVVLVGALLFFRDQTEGGRQLGRELAAAFTQTVQASPIAPLTPTAPNTIAPTSTIAPATTIAPTARPTLRPTETRKPATPVAKGNWRVTTETSELDDTKTVTATLDAEKKVAGSLSLPPALIFRCRKGKLEAYVYVGTQIQNEPGAGDTATARIRFDRNAPETITMGESTAGSGLFFDDPVSIINTMLEHDRVVFGYTPFGRTPTEIAFDLYGIAEAVKPLQEACKF
jgi:type VI secretion system protein VasI